jgi:hypothetical protein
MVSAGQQGERGKLNLLAVSSFLGKITSSREILEGVPRFSATFFVRWGNKPAAETVLLSSELLI